MSVAYLKTSWFGLPDGLPKLTPAGRAVLSQIAWFSRDDGTGAFVSEDVIAAHTGLTARAVRKQIAILKGARYLSCERKKAGKTGCKTVNHYRLLFPVNDVRETTSNRNEVPVGKRNEVPVGNGNEVPVGGGGKRNGVPVGKRNEVPPNNISGSDNLMGRESGSASLCLSDFNSVLAVANENGIPRKFVEFFVEMKKDLKRGEEYLVVEWWLRERRKDRFIDYGDDPGSCECDVPPRRISEEDL